jgi:hypothetical protein
MTTRRVSVFGATAAVVAAPRWSAAQHADPVRRVGVLAPFPETETMGMLPPLPNDLPVEQPTKYDLLVNLKTAKMLSLSVPRSVLLRASQVIE